MSTTIDERVVKMEFDNATFKKNVADTMKQLDNLDEQLNFDGVQKGFQKIENASKTVSLKTIQDGVESITARFSTMGIVAQTAIQNLTNSAVNAGKTLVKSLSVDNIAAGWEKFADKTGSVGTLVAQGYSLDEVNEQLAKLNWYTDETSYNFVDMVSNIAKFTAAGQKLPESVEALMGIANWAALSGQNAMTASRAMYQLSQAMGAGVMRREDYRSIQNASMDTAEFRQQALDAAVALGTLRDNLDGTYTSLINNQGAFTRNQFAEHLTEDAWFTSEVMLKVYNNYASAVNQIYEYVQETGVTASEAIEQLGDKVDAFGLKAFNAGQEARTFRDVIDSVKDAVSTGWMNTYELVFGDYYEAKSLWTDLANSLYDVFTAGVAARNEQLAIWKDLGGRTYILESFWKLWDGIGGAVSTVKNAFREMAPAITGEEMADMSAQVYVLVNALTQMEGVSEKLARIGRGFGAAWKMVNDILYQIGYGTAVGLAKILDALNIDILELIATLADGLTQLYEWVNGGEVIISIIDTITDVISSVIRGIREFFTSLLNTGPIQTFSTHLNNLRLGLLEFIGGLADQKDEFVTYIRTLDGISLENIGKAFEKFREIFLGSFGSNTQTSFAKFVDGMKQGFNDILNDLGNFGRSVKDGFRRVLDWLGHIAWDRIIPAAGFIAMISITRSLTDAVNSLMDSIRPFSRVLLMVGGAIKQWLSAKAFNEKSTAILKIAGAIGILAVSLSILAKSAENWKSLAIAAGTVVGLSAALFGLIIVFNKFGGDADLPGMLGITAFFVALAALVHVIDSAATWKNSLWTAIGILGTFGAFLVLVQYLTKTYVKELPKGTMFFLSLAGAMIAMVKALQMVMGFDWQHGKASIVLATLCLGALTVFLGLAAKAASMAKKAPVLPLISAVIALRMLARLIKDLSDEDYGAMLRGMRLLIPVMASLVGAIAVIRMAGKQIGSAGTGILAMSAGILLLVPALSLLASLPLTKLVKGGLAVAALIVVLDTVMLASKMAGEHAHKAAVAILAVAGAVTILSLAAVGLSLLDARVMWNAVLAIESLVLGFAYLTKSLRFIPDNEGKKVSRLIGSLRRTLIVLAGSVAILSTLDEDAVKAARNAMFLVMAAFIELALATKKIKMKDGTTKNLLKLSGIVAILAGIIGVMSTFPDSQSILPKVASLSLLLLAMSAALRIIDDSKISGAHIGAIAVLGLVAAGLAIAMGEISSWPLTSSLLQNTIGLSALILALAGALNLMGNIPPKGVLIAFLGVIGILAVILAALWGIGAMYKNNFLGFKDSVLGFATMIGDFISAIGIALAQGAETITGIMVKVADNLATFSEHIGPFVESMNGIGENAGMIDAAKSLVEVILIMAQADFVNGINSLLGFGETDMAGFATRMEALGEGMRLYALKINTIKDPNGMLERSVDIAESLVALEQGIPRQGGALQEFLGSKSLMVFGSQLGALAEGLVIYANKVATIKDFDIVEASTSAASALAELNNNLPPQGGRLQYWLGSQDLSTFGQSMYDLANGLVRYTKKITELKDTDYVNAIKNSVVAAETLVKLNEKLIPQGGLIDAIAGRQNLAEFGDNLVSLANSLVNYCTTVGTVDYELMATSVSTLTDLSTVANDIPEDTKWITSLSQGLANVGDMYRTLGALDETTVSNGVDRLEDIVEGLEGLVDSKSKEGILTITKLLEAMGNTSVSAFFEAITASSADYVGAGETIALKVVEGMANKFKEPGVVQYAVGYIIDIVSLSGDFAETEGQDVGLDFSAGYAKGISDIVSEEKVKAAATKIGALSIESLRAAIESQSPAKATAEVGGDYDAGFAQGISEEADQVAEEAKELGDTAVESLGTDESARAKGAGFGRGFLNGLMSVIGAGKAGGWGAAIEEAKNQLFGNDTVEDFTAQAEELGNSISNSLTSALSSGITTDTSVTSAAQSKADQIREIFSDALSGLSSDITTTDLEYKLWQALNPNAPAGVASDVETQMLINKANAQIERVNLTKQQYEKALAELGADDTDTKDMYQTYLKEMTTLVETTTSLKTANQGVVDNLNATREAYLKYLSDTAEIERMGLFTHEELVRAAQNATGYNPDITAENMTSKVNAALTNAHNALQVRYQTLAMDSIATVSSDAATAGVTAAYSAAEGMETGTPYVAEAGVDISDSALAGLSAGQDSFYEQGIADANSYAAGLSSAQSLSAINGATSGWGFGGYSGASGYGGSGGNGNRTLYYDFIGVMRDWEQNQDDERAAEIARMNRAIREGFDSAAEKWLAENPDLDETLSPFYNAFDEFSAAVKNNKYMWLGGEGTLEGSLAEVLGDYSRLGRPDWENKDRYGSSSIYRSDWDEKNRRYESESVIDWQYEYSDGLQKVITGVDGTTRSLDDIQRMAEWASNRGYVLSTSFDQATEAARTFASVLKRQSGGSGGVAGGSVGGGNTVVVNQTNYGNGATIKERKKEVSDISRAIGNAGKKSKSSVYLPMKSNLNKSSVYLPMKKVGANFVQ